MSHSPPRISRYLPGAIGLLLLAAACTTTTLQAEPPDASGSDLDGSVPRLDASAPGDDHDGSPLPRADGGSDGAPEKDAAVADARPPVDCSAPPPAPLFTSLAGPYCPFQAGSVFSNCQLGEHCCEYAEGDGIPSTCSAGATACGVAIATGFDWRCDESNDCPGGQVCCFGGTIAPRLECPGQFAASVNAHGSACRAGTCAVGEMRMCSSSGECAAGQLCLPIRVRGKHFEFCN